MRRKKKEKGRVNIFSAITIFQAYSNYFLHIGSLNLVNRFISFSVTHSSFSSVITSVTHFSVTHFTVTHSSFSVICALMDCSTRGSAVLH